jgi:hypothetical protein
MTMEEWVEEFDGMPWDLSQVCVSILENVDESEDDAAILDYAAKYLYIEGELYTMLGEYNFEFG